MCDKCREIIEWKRQYGKYKPLKQAAKCSACNQRAIDLAYHVLCPGCATSRRCCAKCQAPMRTGGKSAADELMEGLPTPETIAAARKFFYDQKVKDAEDIRKNEELWKSERRKDSSDALFRAKANKDESLKTRANAKSLRADIEKSRAEIAKQIKDKMRKLDDISIQNMAVCEMISRCCSTCPRCRRRDRSRAAYWSLELQSRCIAVITSPKTTAKTTLPSIMMMIETIRLPHCPSPCAPSF